MALFREIREDIQTVLERDPAARNSLEVLICYPGVWALILHKPAHWCYRMHLKMLARIISQLARFFTGIEIHPGATVGRRCFIDHGNGMTTKYAHCDAITVNVGDVVSQGQKIGTVGRSGNATGNILHYEVLINGKNQNPINYLDY